MYLVYVTFGWPILAGIGNPFLLKFIFKCLLYHMKQELANLLWIGQSLKKFMRKSDINRKRPLAVSFHLQTISILNSVREIYTKRTGACKSISRVSTGETTSLNLPVKTDNDCASRGPMMFGQNNRMNIPRSFPRDLRVWCMWIPLIEEAHGRLPDLSWT